MLPPNDRAISGGGFGPAAPSPGQTRSSRATSQGALCFPRYVDRHEVLRWVEIVFTRLVDYADVPLLGSAPVGELLVDLTQLEVLAPSVADAEQKPLLLSCRRHQRHRSRHASNDPAVQQRAREGAKRPTRPSDCNGGLGGSPSWAANAHTGRPTRVTSPWLPSRFISHRHRPRGELQS